MSKKVFLRVIEKTLSANDIGDTGGHQAGILVPKNVVILNFFPKLDANEKNPRVILDIKDDVGRDWTFCFIYYNNKFFGGTRNEFRLTGMTAFFREFDLKAGDTLIFAKIDERNTNISYRRESAAAQNKVIKLSSAWKIINTNSES